MIGVKRKKSTITRIILLWRDKKLLAAGVKGSEAVNGKASHGDHMDKVDKKVKEKIKNHPEYEKGKKKQKNLDKAKSEIKSRNLKIDWWHIGDVILAIGIVIACTATFFFQGDDIGAIPFFRTTNGFRICPKIFFGIDINHTTAF